MELRNRRRAIGYLKTKEAVREYEGNQYTSFVIRYIDKGSKKFRVVDYSFKCGKKLIPDLQLISINQMVCVGFQIESKPRKYELRGEEVTVIDISLRALDIFEYGGEAKEWMWLIQDYDDIKETKPLRDEFPDPPDIVHRRRAQPLDATQEVSNYVKAKGAYKAPVKKFKPETDADIPPF